MAVIKSAAIAVLLLGLCSYSAGRRVVDYEEANDRPPVSARKTQDASIVNQIHRHDPDGSYTYGFEGSDGSFKIETKTRTGEVTGKYGYVDDSGKLRVVEYGANERGFRPSGEGITVPDPPPPAPPGESRDRDDGWEDAAESQPPPPPPPQRRPVNKPSAKPRQRPAATFRDEPETAAYVRQPTAAAPRSLQSLYRPAGSAGLGSSPAEKDETPALSGSFRTVQEFGDKAARAGNSYRTVEEYQEPQTPEPPTFYRPAAVKPTAGRRAVSPRKPSAVAAPGRSWTGAAVDRSLPPAEQYAWPESDASFGPPSGSA